MRHFSFLNRRLVAMLLSLSMLASLTACSSGNSPDHGGSNSAGENSTSDLAVGGNTNDMSENNDDTHGTEPDLGGGEPSIDNAGEDSKDTADTDEKTGAYDYSAPVPEREAVEDSYFDDAVFIGNSRTEGFMLYAGPSEADYLTAVGLMVDTFFTKNYISQNGSKVTAADALKNLSFDKVYIMLGMNELGWVYSSVFKEKYGEIIDYIREVNPDATIYIQSILPVTATRDQNDKIYNNAKINEYNTLLQELAAEKEVYYVNVAEAVADENGQLPEEGSFDGVHLQPDYCKTWMSYLKTHTVEE